MLNRYKIVTTIPAVNLDRARKFYKETLGLKELASHAEEPSLLFEAGGGTRLYIYKRGQTKADHTVFGLEVSNIEKIVSTLKKRGVQFEEYSFESWKTVGSVATFGSERDAWFRDSEGNTIGLFENKF